MIRLRTREAEPEDYDGGAFKDYRYRVERVVADDGHSDLVRAELRALRARGVDVGPLRCDVLPNPEGSTRRGVPPDYDGSDPRLCNARTKSGKPCRAIKLAHGRCKWHGGLSTGPRTPEGKAASARNLAKARLRLESLRAEAHHFRTCTRRRE